MFWFSLPFNPLEILKSSIPLRDARMNMEMMFPMNGGILVQNTMDPKKVGWTLGILRATKPLVKFFMAWPLSYEDFLDIHRRFGPHAWHECAIVAFLWRWACRTVRLPLPKKWFECAFRRACWRFRSLSWRCVFDGHKPRGNGFLKEFLLGTQPTKFGWGKPKYGPHGNPST